MITRSFLPQKGQETQYSYDAYGRLVQVRHYGWGYQAQALQEIPDERIDYYYDTNPCGGSFSQNTWGRLAAVNFTMNGYNDGCRYQYSYNTAGRMTSQKMTWKMRHATQDPVEFAMTAGYEWDNEGRMTYLTYPTPGGTGTKYSYQFDAMGRMNGMTDTGNGVQFIGATYGVAGELLTLGGETRTYNNMFQMTRQTVSGMMDMQYRYTAGANNGRIAKSIDGITGETVDYTYDVWNRLVKAETEGTTGVQWGQSYTYDGFGNLTAKGVTKGSAPTFSTTINPATNGGPTSYPHVQFDGSTDVENRPIAGFNFEYNYDPAGKRVLARTGGTSGGYWYSGNWEIAMYGPGGQRLVTVNCAYVNNTYANCVDGGKNIYFGGKLVVSRGLAVVTDRLGSVRATANGDRFSYYPYGEERTTTADGREKFGTYVRDSAGTDYADQRYYNVGTGRYFTPKSYRVDPTLPGKMNQYAYVQGDPINFNNPHGGELDEDDDVDVIDVPDVDQQNPGTKGPTGGSGDDVRTTNLVAGKNLAKEWLKKDKCVKLIGAEVREENQNYEALSGRLDDANPRFSSDLPSPTATVDPSNPSRVVVSYKLGVTTEDNDILLNGNIFPNPGKPIGNTTANVLDAFNSNYGGQYSATEMLAITILHELSHVLRRPDDTNDADATKKFNQDIISNCLK